MLDCMIAPSLRCTSHFIYCVHRQLHSSSAAKNHLGKVLYGNMYNEIKSGAACNTLVTEYVLRKNPRGDAEIDTEESPFLRDNLRDKLPSLAERKRRRQRRHAGSNPSTTALKPSMPTSRPDVAAAAHGAVAVTGHELELPTKTGEGDEGNLAEQRFDQGCATVLQGVGGEGRPRQDPGASASRSPNCRHGLSDKSKTQGKRLPRRPNFKAPIDSRLAERGGSSDEGHNLNENQSRSRSRDRMHDSEGTRVTGAENSSYGGRESASSPRIAGEVGGRRRQITTSASLKTLSLHEMEEREDGSRSKGNAYDALDRWVDHGGKAGNCLCV